MTASLNVLETSWEQHENKLKINVKQGFHSDQHRTLRFRRAEVAIFNDKAETFKTLSLLVHPKAEECFEF